jgi:hypothetical protein
MKDETCGAPAGNWNVTRRDALRRLGAGGLLLSAGGLLHAAEPRRGGTLTIATQSSSTADTLDPAKGALSTDYLRTHMFYSCLTGLDPQLAPKMMLAEEISTDDAITWTVQLRKGVHFRRFPAVRLRAFQRATHGRDRAEGRQCRPARRSGDLAFRHPGRRHHQF